MKVKQVLAHAAANLGREDLVAQLNDCIAEPSGELAELLRCYHLVENEIALDYFPLKREDVLCAVGGMVPYKRLRCAPVTVLSVRGEDGVSLPFEMRPAFLLLRGRVKCGRVRVEYTYSPREKELCDECEFGAKISARLLSFGVSCEFCLSHGQYEEAAMWEKRYREAIRAAKIPRRRLSVRARRWI